MELLSVLKTMNPNKYSARFQHSETLELTLPTMGGKGFGQEQWAQQQHVWPWGRHRLHQIYFWPPVWENGKESWTIVFVICAQPGAFPKISKLIGSMSEFSREILFSLSEEEVTTGTGSCGLLRWYASEIQFADLWLCVFIYWLSCGST